MRRVLVALALAGASCSKTPDGLATGEPWPEAEALFHRDPRWLGADGAYSVDLGGGRVLWLFGDTFVATSPANVRSESKMVRNTVAIETGYDPSTATMVFAWAPGPSDFFSAPAQAPDWYWPAHGAMVDGQLVVFLSRVAPASGGLGFRADGWRAVRIDDPDADPASWRPVALTVPPSTFSVTFGEAALVRDDWLYVFGAHDDSHEVHVLRWSKAAIAAGDLSAPEWRTPSGWVPLSALTSPPPAVFGDGATELSISPSRRGGWVEVQTEGFGAATLQVRTAPDFLGPWGDLGKVYDPPESAHSDAFVYAGKAHPELQGADLVATYAANSMSFRALVANDSLYYPRVVRLHWR